jgi:hypothetical protein
MASIQPGPNLRKGTFYEGENCGGLHNEEHDRVPLTDIDAYRDRSAVADRLVSEFQSLPWHYALTVEMPLGIGDTLHRVIRNHALSTSVRVIAPDEQFTTEYPPPPGTGTLPRLTTLRDLLSGYQARWNPNNVYLQIRTAGFIPPFGSSAPLEEGIDTIKSFFGLGLALNLCRRGNRFGEPPANAYLWVHRLAGERWEYERYTELDSSLSALLYKLTFDDRDGTVDTEEQRKAFAKAILVRMGIVFSAGQPANRLLLASHWLLDSYSGSDTMLAFVQAAVVLEILLGDKAVSEVVGLGELLRNRCAYLISHSQAERDEILREFPRIYSVRSSIVHAGKKRLSRDEWLLFVRLRWICQRVIQEESRLLAGKRS